MKFHALLPVRDEADIIDQSLRHLLTWADAVYVYDTGSFDETWEIVQELASKDKRIVPLRKADVFFSEKRVRGWMFHTARQWMREGDWFLRVDADEFHHVSPREFVTTRMKKHETLACYQYYDFRLIALEVRAWEECVETMGDRIRPIELRRRWFTVSPYTEPRLCRYRESMQWPETVSFPHNAGYVARERLPIRHYPHRDPLQLERRCRIRATMLIEPDNAAIRHWALNNWREHIVPDNSPELRYWKPGTELPRLEFANHLAPIPKRVLQRVVHARFLRLLDRLRPGYPDGVLPRTIPDEVSLKLARELGFKTAFARFRGFEKGFDLN